MELKNKRILIVEDDGVNRRVYERMAKQMGFSAENIDLACCAEDALELLKNRKFELLLTDNNMAVMTGLELIDECKKSYSSMKMILMSGRLEQLMATGKIPDGISTIAKPFGAEVFSVIIKKALE